VQFDEQTFSIKAALAAALATFSRREKVKLFGFSIAQMGLGFLDLLAIGLLGLLGSLSVTGVQSLNPTGKVASLLSLIRVDDWSLQGQISVLGLMAGSLLAIKTIISLLITRRNLFFLSTRSAKISISLVEKLMKKSLLELQTKTTQENLYSVQLGVSTLITGILGSFLGFLADTTLLLILFTGLIFVDLVSTIATLIFFIGVGITLHKLLNVRVRLLSEQTVSNTIQLNSRILEIVTAYRELVVRDRREYYLSEISKVRLEGAKLESELGFVPNISKYAIDISLVLGSLMIAGLQFAVNDARHAVGSLLIFLVAAMRIGPAVLRLHQGILTMKNGTATARPTLVLLSQESTSVIEPQNKCEISGFDINHRGFIPKVEITELTFAYAKDSPWALSDINLSIEPSTMVAIVGPSGAGKTTLVDLILGIFPPDQGKVEISNQAPHESFRAHPGAVAYVPQEVFISNGTVKENVCLGFNAKEISEEVIWDAIRSASLETFVKSLDRGINTPVGEFGSRLSGGQRQRLGIARALLTKPSLLVLDEATSSLDSISESEISQSINKIRGEVTVIVIAHRLSTVRDADQVIYLEKGRILAQGLFDDVQRSIPSFATQVKLAGL
jgi:ABC-type multidrug transport system fused ATPase/permease subunit